MQLVSVILPVYNVEQYFEKCMISLLNQSYKNMEIILVDDGSTDSSGSLCDRYKVMDSRVKVIHQENGGLISASSRGVKESSKESKYVAFVDSDDWVSERYIEKLVEAQEKTGADVVAAPMTIACIDHEDVKLNYLPAKLYMAESLQNEMYPRLLNVGNFDQRGIHMSRCSKLIDKQLVLNNIHYLDKKVTFCEDVNIMFAVILDAKSVLVIDDLECMYYYRQNPNSMLRSYDKNMLYSIKAVHQSLFKICDDKRQLKMKSQVYANYLVGAVQGYKNELQNSDSFRNVYQNIETLVNTSTFKYALEHTDCHQYKRKLNVLILHILSRPKSVLSISMTILLRIIKNMKDFCIQKKSINWG